MWDEITYSFPNFNGCTFEVWEWINNSIPHFIMGEVTFMLGLKLIHISKKGPVASFMFLSSKMICYNISSTWPQVMHNTDEKNEMYFHQNIFCF